jgi:pimeloyl-ACP methyl ester carboxylesterase
VAEEPPAGADPSLRQLLSRTLPRRAAAAAVGTSGLPAGAPTRVSAPVDPTFVRLEGPWRHREVSANGVRFHVAETGPADPGGAPLVLLLHGFPEFWWSWHHQLVALGEAGFRAVAVDLRGFGGTDKPPSGYDLPTLAADVAGLVRALGEEQAVLVGHDWGGVLAWSAAALHPRVVRGIVPVSMAHLLRFKAAILTQPRGQLRASGYMAPFQLLGAERRLLDDDAEAVGALLHRWGGPGFPDAETEELCRKAARIPGAAASAMEYYRGALRSLSAPPLRANALTRRLRRPVAAPVLQLHGSDDPCVLASTARGSGRWVSGSYAWHEFAGVGHFPHEEQPGRVNDLLIDWLRALPA